MARKLDYKPGATIWSACGSTAITSVPRFVKFESGMETVALCDTAGEAPLGIAVNPLKAGEQTAIVLDGIVFIELGATVADGAEVATDSVGRAVTAVAGDVVAGTMLRGGASGEVGSVRLAVKANKSSGGASIVAMGSVALVAGTKTVAETRVKTGDKIFLTSLVAGGTAGLLTVGTIIAATSFVITSASNSDTSTIAWMIVR